MSDDRRYFKELEEFEPLPEETDLRRFLSFQKWNVSVMKIHSAKKIEFTSCSRRVGVSRWQATWFRNVQAPVLC